MSHAKYGSSFPQAGRYAPAPSAVCVTGLPGAGASLVMRLLRDNGLWLGKPEILAPAGDDNSDNTDRGLESRAIADVNEQVVNLLAERRASPEGRSTPWTDLPGIGFLKARAKNALEAIASSAAGRPWGWRHPHSFDTLPFWCELVAPLKAVVCVRNPVTREPKARGEALNGKLARGAYETILRTKLPPWQILVTHHETWFAAPERELERIASFLGLAAVDAAGLAGTSAPLRVTSADGESQAEGFGRPQVAQPWVKRKAA